MRTQVAQKGEAAQTIPDICEAIQFALTLLDDPHGRFFSPQDEHPFDSTAPASPSPTGELLVEGIGCLMIPGFVGSPAKSEVAFATEIQALIRKGLRLAEFKGKNLL